MAREAKEFILQLAKRRRVVGSAEVVRGLHISRQVAAQHLRKLVEEGKLAKTGSTHSARYHLPRARPSPKRLLDPLFDATRVRKGLEEDRVYREASNRLELSVRLTPNAEGIGQYAFTEMLNNAIEHSKSQNVVIHAQCAGGSFRFEIRDHGIGVFRNIREKFKLKDDWEAIEHLLKGKQTTAPARHTGEGVFFTSRIADYYSLRSGGLKLVFDNVKGDAFVADQRGKIAGTEVIFSIKQKSRKSLKALFDAYTDEDFGFDRTCVHVRLTKKEGQYVSRSEAKRLLNGLEKFRRVEFDFRGISGIGQAFADEVFRVFPSVHPGVCVIGVHASPAVAFMIRRADPKAAIQD